MGETVAQNPLQQKHNNIISTYWEGGKAGLLWYDGNELVLNIKVYRVDMTKADISMLWLQSLSASLG